MFIGCLGAAEAHGFNMIHVALEGCYCFFRVTDRSLIHCTVPSNIMMAAENNVCHRASKWWSETAEECIKHSGMWLTASYLFEAAQSLMLMMIQSCCCCCFTVGWTWALWDEAVSSKDTLIGFMRQVFIQCLVVMMCLSETSLGSQWKTVWTNPLCLVQLCLSVQDNKRSWRPLSSAQTNVICCFSNFSEVLVIRASLMHDVCGIMVTYELL